MASDHIRIRSRILFLTAHDGGRTVALRGPASYRPNHDFSNGTTSDRAMGHITLEAGEVIEPGDTVIRDVDLFIWPEIIPALRQGLSWSICEGPRQVAIGTVLGIVPE